jgi:hypothetical protein
VSGDGLFLQFEGEVLDLTLAWCAGSAESAARHVDEAFRTCAERLETVARKAGKVAARLPGVAAAQVALEEAQARVRRATPAAYAARLSEHLHRSDRWRDAFAALAP